MEITTDAFAHWKYFENCQATTKALTVYREQSEVLTQDFDELFNCLDNLEAQFLLGDHCQRSTEGSAGSTLSKTCSLKGINYIDNFNLFRGCRYLFGADGLHPSARPKDDAP